MGRVRNRVRRTADAGRSAAVVAPLTVASPREPAPVVTGTPRSGTTSLAEQLAARTRSITPRPLGVAGHVGQDRERRLGAAADVDLADDLDHPGSRRGRGVVERHAGVSR